MTSSRVGANTTVSHNLYVEWVMGPLVDGVRVYRKRLGAFNRQGKVLRPPVGALEPDAVTIPKTARVLRFLLVPLDRKGGVTIVLNSKREPVGEIDHGQSETPWPGVEPETCKFKLGDTVGLVAPDYSYRLGIVAGIPLSKAEVERHGGVETWDGATYLVMHDPGASTHLHLREPMLIPVDADAVAPNRVRRRFERSQPRKPIGGSLVSTHRWEVEEAAAHQLEEWFSTLPNDDTGNNHLGVQIEELWFHGSVEDLRACIAEVAKKTGLTVQKVRGNCTRAFGPR